MGVESNLIKEIGKWSKKLDNSLTNIQPHGDRGIRMLQNIKAYCDDSKHFFNRGDLIKSFECLVWAWAILELGKELDLFVDPTVKGVK